MFNSQTSLKQNISSNGSLGVKIKCIRSHSQLLLLSVFLTFWFWLFTHPPGRLFWFCLSHGPAPSSRLSLLSVSGRITDCQHQKGPPGVKVLPVAFGKPAGLTAPTHHQPLLPRGCPWATCRHLPKGLLSLGRELPSSTSINTCSFFSSFLALLSAF